MPLDDLLPLFLSEALDRLERLDEILGKGAPAEDSEDWRSARRELHTLKGAGRMMGLPKIAEVCHQAEGTFDDFEGQGFEDLLTLVQRIRKMIGSLRTAEGRQTGEQENSTPKQKPKVITGEPAPDLRVPAEVLDRISDQAVRLSFLSRGAGVMVEDMHAMARAAESGVNDRHPEQVLAILALRLRRTALIAGQSRSHSDRLIEQQMGDLFSIQVQSVRPLLTSLGRHAVELGSSLGKSVGVRVEATKCRLDCRIMDALKEALVHLVRNAVDHGIEAEPERIRLGKSPAGTIVLRAETMAGRVRLVVSDDGHGIDPRSVLGRAIEQGLVTAEAAENMSDDAVRQLLFLPGFSTRDQASEVSGRGIGLDSVADAVRKIGGDVWIDGGPGMGITVTLNLPVTRRGESILVVRAGGFLVGIPTHQVHAFSGPEAARRPAEARDNDAEDKACRLHLGSRLGQADGSASTVVHLEFAGVPVDLVVDNVIGEEEVFLQPWPQFLVDSPGTEALAVLANGTPIAVLDLQHFVQADDHGNQIVIEAPAQAPALKVLLVDDSRITREMLRRILVDAGIEVISVAAGEEALAILEIREVDCLVTDIEMPGIDGLELTRRIRGRSQWEHLPVVVVSTRNQADDRMAGLQAGADAYLAKQNLIGGDLVALVQRFGGQR